MVVRGSIGALLLSLLAAARIAFGVDPSRTIAELYHSAWTVEDGAPSSIYALAQTKDGYLWLGTFNGLFRFDGVRFQRYQPERGDPFPSQSIVALFATPDGGLWISFRTGGVTFLENGRGHSYGESEGLPPQAINGFALDREGAIWAGTYRGLFRFMNSHWHKIGTEWGYFAERASPPFLDSQGRLWVNGYSDLYCLLPGAHVFNMRKVPNGWPLQQTPDGTLWMFDLDKGIRAVYGPLGEFYDRSKASVSPGLFPSLVDREGGFWMSSGDIDGIKRLSNLSTLPNVPIERTSSLLQKFTHKDGLTSDFINRMLEDTEGNIWVATADGLDRFRRRHVVKVPFPTSKTNYEPLLVTDQKGIIWEGTRESLWTVASDGVSPREGPRIPLPIGVPRAWSEMTCGWLDLRGAIWIGGRGILTRWSEGRVENVEFPDKDAVAGHWDIQSITGNQAGDLWVVIEQHGVFRRRDGVWEQYGKRLGLPKSGGLILWTDSKDRVWFGYVGNRIALVDGDRVKILSSPDGLHVGNVLAIGGRGDHIWAAGQFGLALFDGSKFHTIAGEADADFRGISGVVETANGDFWLNMASGVARISAAEIANRLRDPQAKLQYDLLDFRDGLRGVATQIRPLPSMVQAGDGRIWISGSNGVYWIDPAHIYKNPVPPPVTIEAIYEGDRRFSAFEASRLSKLPQNVRVEYTALSLSIPERVRFRYQLEGYDKDWQDVGTRRAAYYPKLPPGHFRFHVIACNNDGVWNQTGAVAEIVVPPAFYQTAWFEALCAFAGLALLWVMYRYRLHQIAREFNMRLEERVNERTRLARDLHDTLLQGFQGLMLRLQAIDEALPEGEIKDELGRTLDRGDQVVVESRKAVHDLRLSTVVTNDLARAVQTMGDELSSAGSATFAMTVEGETRELHPIVRDEIYRITREALRNAFSHARANHIEAEITYGEQLFRLRIRDDGEGIEPAMLEKGRPGHYGLPGMRERAAEMGAKLDIWSGEGTGTEIDLSIAGSIAYGKGRMKL